MAWKWVKIALPRNFCPCMGKFEDILGHLKQNIYLVEGIFSKILNRCIGKWNQNSVPVTCQVNLLYVLQNKNYCAYFFIFSSADLTISRAYLMDGHPLSVHPSSIYNYIFYFFSNLKTASRILFKLGRDVFWLHGSLLNLCTWCCSMPSSLAN